MAKKKKRRHNKSASKGGGFERQMCRIWSHWWTDGKRDDIFWRTSGSGSRATTRAKRGKTDKWNHGDMRPDDPEGFRLCWNWCFEFKFYQKYDIKGVLHHVADNGNWLEWWAKIWDEAQGVGRDPVLVTKQNRGAPVIWFSHNLWLRLCSRATFLADRPLIRLRVIQQKVRVRFKNKARKTKMVKLPLHNVFGILLDDFFEVFEPETLKAWVLRVYNGE